MQAKSNNLGNAKSVRQKQYIDKYLELKFEVKSKITNETFNLSMKVREFSFKRLYQDLSEISSVINKWMDVTDKRTPVYFFQSDNSILVKLLEELNGAKFGSGTSLYSEKVGIKVFSSDFSLKMENDSYKTFSPEYDAEGSILDESKSYLIKNGVILRPYTDKNSSKRYNLDYTASAYSSYSSTPQIGWIYPNIVTDEYKIVKEGVLVVSHSSYFDSHGDFYSRVYLAFKLKDNKLVGKLKPFSIKTSVSKMWGKSFQGCANIENLSYNSKIVGFTAKTEIIE